MSLHFLILNKSCHELLDLLDDGAESHAGGLGRTSGVAFGLARLPQARKFA